MKKVYFRSKILDCPSIGKNWIISAVLVFLKNVIFVSVRK